MGAIRRAAFSGSLFVGAGMAGIFWLYLTDTAQPLASKYVLVGPFADQWQLLKWAFPTACLLIMFAAGLYLVYGGVQEERKADRITRGRP